MYNNFYLCIMLLCTILVIKAKLTKKISSGNRTSARDSGVGLLDSDHNIQFDSKPPPSNAHVSTDAQPPQQVSYNIMYKYYVTCIHFRLYHYMLISVSNHLINPHVHVYLKMMMYNVLMYRELFVQNVQRHVCTDITVYCVILYIYSQDDDDVQYAGIQGTVYPKWPETCMYRYYCILCNTLYLL